MELCALVKLCGYTMVLTRSFRGPQFSLILELFVFCSPTEPVGLFYKQLAALTPSREGFFLFFKS